MSRRGWLLIALTVAFCAGLVTNIDAVPISAWLRGAVPWLAPDARWVWPYSLPRLAWIIPCALGLAVYVGGAIYLLRHQDRSPRKLILWSFCGAVLICLLLLTLEGRPLFLLFTRSASTVTGGYQYAAAMTDNLGETLRHWPDFVQRFRSETLIYGGVALDPPGLTAVYYSAGKALGAAPPLADWLAMLVRPLECQNLIMMTWTDAQIGSAWVQIFMPLWAGLAVAPLYRLGVCVFDKQTARMAVVLWPLVPGLNMFSPRFNVFYPLITVVLLSVLWRGLDRKRPILVGLAGFIVSAATFFNLSLVPLGLLGGLTIVGHWVWGSRPHPLAPSPNYGEGEKMRDGARRTAPLLGNLGVFGIGSVSIWGIYGALSGVSVIDIAALGLGAHFTMNRPYLPWLALHPYDMFLFVGLPFAMLAIVAIWRLVRQPVGRSGVFAMAAALTLILLTLSGTARGETGRVWLFLAPLWILLAADVLKRLSRPGPFLWAQALCLLCMAAVLRVHFTALIPPPAPPATERAAAIPVNVQFQRNADSVTLVGFDAEVRADAITLHLHWRADGTVYVRRPYVLSLVPVAPDGSLRESINWAPLDWNYPPSCWLPGEEFIDTVKVPLGDTVIPGDWWFSVAISDAFTREPMVVGGKAETQTGIGPVRVTGATFAPRFRKNQ